MRCRLVLPAVCLLFAAACSPAPTAAPKLDVAAEEKAIRDQDARWLKAAAGKDAAGAGALFADDGVAYREHVDPIVGPAAVQAFEAKFFAGNSKASVTWTTDSIQVAEAGDLAIQTGEYNITGLGPKSDGMDKGRFVTVWRSVNGEWKVAHDIGSTTMPEPVPATAKQP